MKRVGPALVAVGVVGFLLIWAAYGAPLPWGYVTTSEIEGTMLEQLEITETDFDENVAGGSSEVDVEVTSVDCVRTSNTAAFCIVEGDQDGDDRSYGYTVAIDRTSGEYIWGRES